MYYRFSCQHKHQYQRIHSHSNSMNGKTIKSCHASAGLVRRCSRWGEKLYDERKVEENRSKKKTVLSKPIEIEETKLCVHVKQTYTLAMIPNSRDGCEFYYSQHSLAFPWSHRWIWWLCCCWWDGGCHCIWKVRANISIHFSSSKYVRSEHTERLRNHMFWGGFRQLLIAFCFVRSLTIQSSTHLMHCEQRRDGGGGEWAQLDEVST